MDVRPQLGNLSVYSVLHFMGRSVFLEFQRVKRELLKVIGHVIVLRRFLRKLVNVVSASGYVQVQLTRVDTVLKYNITYEHIEYKLRIN